MAYPLRWERKGLDSIAIPFNSLFKHTFTGLRHHFSLNYCKHGLDKNNLTTGITLLTIDNDMYKLG